MVIPPGRMAVVKFFLMIQNIKKKKEKASSNFLFSFHFNLDQNVKMGFTLV